MQSGDGGLCLVPIGNSPETCKVDGCILSAQGGGGHGQAEVQDLQGTASGAPLPVTKVAWCPIPWGHTGSPPAGYRSRPVSKGYSSTPKLLLSLTVQ